jgi:hypothetical protein
VGGTVREFTQQLDEREEMQAEKGARHKGSGKAVQDTARPETRRSMARCF